MQKNTNQNKRSCSCWMIAQMMLRCVCSIRYWWSSLSHWNAWHLPTSSADITPACRGNSTTKSGLCLSSLLSMRSHSYIPALCFYLFGIIFIRWCLQWSCDFLWWLGPRHMTCHCQLTIIDISRKYRMACRPAISAPQTHLLICRPTKNNVKIMTDIVGQQCQLHVGTCCTWLIIVGSQNNAKMTANMPLSADSDGKCGVALKVIVCIYLCATIRHTLILVISHQLEHH